MAPSGRAVKSTEEEHRAAKGSLGPKGHLEYNLSWGECENWN